MGCPQSKSNRRSTEQSTMKTGHEERKENIKVNMFSFSTSMM
jgi:hypothetical protein